jgi:uncharacterized protein
MIDIRHPFGFEHGRTAVADHAAHVRQLIEMLLFTSRGERVNRPDFGGGLLHLNFEPNSDALAATLQAQVHGALQRWLGDVIDVRDLEVENIDSRLVVTLVYSLVDTDETHMESFERSVA